MIILRAQNRAPNFKIKDNFLFLSHTCISNMIYVPNKTVGSIDNFKTKHLINATIYLYKTLRSSILYKTSYHLF